MDFSHFFFFWNEKFWWWKVSHNSILIIFLFRLNISWLQSQCMLLKSLRTISIWQHLVYALFIFRYLKKLPIYYTFQCIHHKNGAVRYVWTLAHSIFLFLFWEINENTERNVKKWCKFIASRFSQTLWLMKTIITNHQN